MRIPPSRSLFEELEARFLADADDSAAERFVSSVRARGWLTKPDFRAVCRWKAPRTAPLVRRNTPSEIRDATAVAQEGLGEGVAGKIGLVNERA